MFHQEIVLSHEVSNLQVSFDLSGGFCGLSPGEVVSSREGSSSSSFPGVSPVFGRMASFLVTDEALVVPYVLCSFTGREIYLIHIHGIGVGTSGSVSRRDVTISSSSEFPESYHILVELSCFVEPLFPFQTGLFLTVRKGGGSHHDSELLSNSSLKGVYKDAVIVNSTACLGQFEGSGVFIEVSIELVHAEGIDGLAGSVFYIFWDKGFFKGLA